MAPHASNRTTRPSTRHCLLSRGSASGVLAATSLSVALAACGGGSPGTDVGSSSDALSGPTSGLGPGYCAADIKGGYRLGSSYADVYTCGPLVTFQCVEYVARYFHNVYKLSASGIDYGLHAASILHGRYPQYGLGSPGPGRLPAPGDIISLWGPSTSDAYGHTGVVAAVSVNAAGNGTITFYAENGTSNGVDHIQVTSWRLTYEKPGNPFYYDQFNWLELGSSSSPPPPPPPPSSPAAETAFQANTGDLWTSGPAGNEDWKLGMMAGTSPSLVVLHGGGFEVAFQANTGALWTVGSAGNKDWGLGMMHGTSPSIAALTNGGFEVAFQASTGDLWTAGSAETKNWGLGMKAGTSPSIAGLPSDGFEVAFQANTGDLWTAGSDGNKNWALGMMAGTSPSIAALSSGAFEVAFQANTGDLWTAASTGNKNWGLGMMRGTSPSIAALSGGAFEVSFQANSGDLWTAGSAGNKNWGLGMMAGTSPSIAPLPSNAFEVSFEANTGDLWTAGSTGGTDRKLGMMKGTSPSGS
jgi:hypothetical protein